MVKSVRELMLGDTATLHASAAETITGESAVFDVGYLRNADFVSVLNCSARSGTNPTLDVTIVNIDPISLQEDTIITFTQVTSVSAQWKYAMDTGKKLGNKIKAKWTIGGSAGPTFTFSLSFMSKN